MTGGPLWRCATCDVLGLAEPTYYAVAKRTSSLRTVTDPAENVEIRRVWESNCRVYAAKGVWPSLRPEGYQVARCTVELRRFGSVRELR